ncbi:MAG: hypothetical protein ACPG4T_14970, partial [Nannocystaceae bacterium]
TDLYKAADAYLAQKPASNRLQLGRRDPGDVTWADALTAITTEDAEAFKFTFPGLALDNTGDPEKMEIATWVAQNKRAIAIMETNDQAVYDGDVGNLAEQFHTVLGPQNVGRAILLWHDPVAASGALAPVANTSEGPWNLFNSATGTRALTMTQDPQGVGTEETFTVDGARPFEDTTDAPWSIPDGDTLTDQIQGGDVATATVIAKAAIFASTDSPWDFVTLGITDGTLISVTTDTGTDSYNLDYANYGDPGAATSDEARDEFLANINPAVATSSSDGTVWSASSVTEGRAASLLMESDNAVTFTPTVLGAGGPFAGSGNVNDNTAITRDEMLIILGALNSTVTTIPTSALRLTGGDPGTNGMLTIGGDAGFLAALGLVAGDTAGTGNVPNALSVTPAELFALWNAAYSTNNTNNITYITAQGALGAGRWHQLAFAGSLRTLLGLPALVTGVGDEDDKMAARVMGARLIKPVADTDLQTWDWAPIYEGFPDTIPLNVSVRLRREDDVCTVEPRSSVGAPLGYLHDGRLCTRLPDTGEPVFVDVLVGVDELAIRMQTAFLQLFERMGLSGTGVSYTDPAARPVILRTVSAVLEGAVADEILAFADLTPPTDSKPTGVTVSLKAGLTAAQRSVRHWQVTLIQQAAGKLHGVDVIQTTINA